MNDKQAKLVEIYFTYHPPTPEDIAKHRLIRDKAAELAEMIYDNTPESADQTVAIRKLRECVAMANAAIACAVKSNAAIVRTPSSSRFALRLHNVDNGTLEVLVYYYEAFISSVQLEKGELFRMPGAINKVTDLILHALRERQMVVDDAAESWILDRVRELLTQAAKE